MRVISFVMLVLLVGECKSADPSWEFHDSHYHLTNYIQEGTDIRDFLRIMGSRAGRVAIFGIPLQQQWSSRVDGDNASGPE